MSHDGGGPGFVPGRSDPAEYDFAALRYLIRAGREAIEPAVAALQEAKYQFPSMRELDTDAIDIELLYRQCIPSAGIALRLGLPAEEVARYLYLFATCQTLILNHIDRHLDLSRSFSLRDPSLLLADVHAVMCYAVAQLYFGMRARPSGGDAPAALKEMSAVSGVIIQSMYDNYATRYSTGLLHEPGLILSAYRDPVRSRHLGSGFYASSIRGLYAYFGIEIPDSLAEILPDMRRLRQRVDELSDIFEDTATGLISYPVALLLDNDGYRDRATELVSALWARSAQIIGAGIGDAGKASFALIADEELQREHAVLRQLLEESGTLTRCYAEASELWLAIRAKASRTLPGPVSDIIRVVVDLKRALLERLADLNWDNRINHTFFDVLAEAREAEHERPGTRELG